MVARKSINQSLQGTSAGGVLIEPDKKLSEVKGSDCHNGFKPCNGLHDSRHLEFKKRNKEGAK